MLDEKARAYNPGSNNITVGIEEGRVFVKFSESTTGLYMAPLDALTLAALLVESVICADKNQAQTLIRPA